MHGALQRKPLTSSAQTEAPNDDDDVNVGYSRYRYDDPGKVDMYLIELVNTFSELVNVLLT